MSVSPLGTLTAVGAGTKVNIGPLEPPLTFQVTGSTSSGSGSAIVKLQVSNTGGSTDGEWMNAGTVTLILSASSTSDGFVINTRWPFARMYVPTISGTGASVSGTIGG